MMNCHTHTAFMARSVIYASTPRCDRCRLAPRWCICAGLQNIDCSLRVDVLIHHREFVRPTSTGRLITRVIPTARHHQFRRETPPAKETVVLPDHTVWILHPRGELLPADASPKGLQVILLDASWPEAARMTPTVAPWGRLVRLPMTGPSRYWLRTQELAGNYSTVEALLFLLAALGLTKEESQLRLMFELQVYAGLLARGNKLAAVEYLSTSPVREAFPELLRQLDLKRPRI